MKYRLAAAVSVLLAVLAIAIPALAFSNPVRSGAKQSGPPEELLAAFDDGLYRIDGPGALRPLWTEGEVRKILPCPSGWFFLTSSGVLFSADLALFEKRNTGLPIKTYKHFAADKKSFSTEVQDIKDLELDPTDRAFLAACTKDAVFISRDEGASWESLGSPSPISGLKAVAIGPDPASGVKTLWASHPIKGLFSLKVPERSGAPRAKWVAISAGLVLPAGTGSPDEIADIAIVPRAAASRQADQAAAPVADLWVSNSFLPRLSRWDIKRKSFVAVWSRQTDFGCVDSLVPLADGALRFVSDSGIFRAPPDPNWPAAGEARLPLFDEAAWEALAAARSARPDVQLMGLSWGQSGDWSSRTSISELWLVSRVNRKPWRASAEHHNGIYLPTGFVVQPASRAKYDKLLDERRLDSVVVDLKDDFGRLRFTPRDPRISSIGKVTSPLDVETFTSTWKAKGRYLIARIPVFKDQVAYEYAKGKYAVWDYAGKEPWRGYFTVKNPQADGQAEAGTTREYMKEYWVDPYCEEIWAYNIAIANEIIARGFDEIQFDYIRFPTDGDNLDQASYRWRDPGMDKESALASFLRYARENIAAPISIDIYGANGWYRSGVRTGQDVELLAKYVDVICPMFYPSHFEQGFMAQPPAEQRPYRIYKLGSLRNDYIARGRVVVRPYVQAFYMNVSYDRSYYNADYVLREIQGIRDSVNLGMTFWNNVGRYDEVPVFDTLPAPTPRKPPLGAAGGMSFPRIESAAPAAGSGSTRPTAHDESAGGGTESGILD